jgi:transcriptional regulator with XRE-family HTH domain
LRTVVELLYSPPMVNGQRLREIRDAKDLSQGDIERETGLLRYPTCRCLDTVFRSALSGALCGKC